jgi:sulfite reductase alpha subunit-like flavoprotein
MTSANPYGTVKVLYGSQTGNGQSIAEALHTSLSASHKVELSTLNAAKKQHADYLIIVCSTTGNGDPPGD